MASIRWSSVAFRYRRNPDVLHAVELTCAQGVTLLVGPNGAGKSTLLRIGAGVTSPRSGCVAVAGLDVTPTPRDQRTSVGWLPQDLRALRGLTVRQQVSYCGWLAGLSRADAWERSATATASVGLADRLDVKASHLSGGQLRRLGIAQCLVTGPPILLLDEPTAGLDPLERRRFLDVVDSLRSDRTIVISTHDIADLDGRADTVAVLDHGTVPFNGPVREFLSLDPASAHDPVSAYASVIGTPIGRPGARTGAE